MGDPQKFVEWRSRRKTYNGQQLSQMGTQEVARAVQEMYLAARISYHPRKASADLTYPSVDDVFELADYHPAFVCGCLLLEAKTRFGVMHSWSAWLNDSVAIPQKTAQQYMRQARKALGITLPAGHAVYRKRPITKLVAKAVYERDGWQCYLCGEPTPKELLGSRDQNAPSLDHIIPESAGGDPTIDNLKCACWQCNAKKGARTEPVTEIILRNALANCLRYLAAKLDLNPKFKDEGTLPQAEMQRLLM